MRADTKGEGSQRDKTRGNVNVMMLCRPEEERDMLKTELKQNEQNVTITV